MGIGPYEGNHWERGISMRKLMWFSIGFAVSCGLGAYTFAKWAWVPFVLFAAAWIASRKWQVLKPSGLLAVGCAAGILWFGLFSHFSLSHAKAADGQILETEIQITDYSYETNYGCAADGVLNLNGKTYQVRVYVNEDTTLEPGQTVAGQFRFRFTAPGGIEEATYHSGKGIFLLAYQRGDVVFAEAEKENWRCWPSRLRQGIREILAECFPEKALPFVQALLIGDSSLLSYETDVAFQITGIRHVIAVSGLHVSILFALISMVTRKRRFLTVLLGIPALALFAAAAGFSPSVSRACLMSGLMLIALLTEKEYDGPTALSFAALVMVTCNPLVITAVGFQLSVASVAGIYLFYEPINDFLMNKMGREKGRTLRTRLKKGLAGSVAMSISACLLTTPLCAYYFGMVSLIGVLTNLLTLWVIMPIFLGIIGVCGLSFLWKAGAVILAKIVSIPVYYILWLVKLLAKFPMAAVYTSSIFIVLWLILTYISLIFFSLRKNRRPLQLLCHITITLCIALLLSWYVPGKEKCSITMLDVGQGQCILLQSEGRTFLVDCGGDNDEISADLTAEELLGRGIDTLDGVILTHYDRDHLGGLPFLLTRVGTDLLILPDTEDQGKRELLPSVDGETVLVSDTLTAEYENTRLTVFGPVYGGYSNENSLCVLFETENCVILITGDRSGFGERMLLREFGLPDVDILVAGHHGSRYSTTEDLLDAVTPETMLISVSEDNNYNHPAPELLARLEERGCEIFRTDECGTITIRR